MKCYNCDYHLEEPLPQKCPNCHDNINKKDYQLVSTDRVLDTIKTKKDFAHFIGLPGFHHNPIIPLVLCIICVIIALIAFFQPASLTFEGNFLTLNKERVIYTSFIFIAICLFAYYTHARKVDIFYKDFLLNENQYYINFPFKLAVNIFISDSHKEMVTASIMKKRKDFYERRYKEVKLPRMNSHRFINPQRVRLFYKTHQKFWNRHFRPEAKHVLKTFNPDDETMIVIDGVVHGFLFTKNKVIGIYNVPKVTKKFFKDPTILNIEHEEK
ncbi:MAG: hypothetical protein LBR40_01995 [Bacilli bacterium]|jgi:hypothetical protein|nr:hypothetical protein [Bacilli bacterium]